MIFCILPANLQQLVSQPHICLKLSNRLILFFFPHDFLFFKLRRTCLCTWLGTQISHPPHPPRDDDWQLPLSCRCEMRKANFPTDFLVSITICHFTLALITDIFLPDGNLPTYWVSIFCHSWIMTMSDNMSVNSFNILFFALDRLVTLCKILDPGRKLPLCYM